MAILHLAEGDTRVLTVVVGSLLVVSSLLFYLFRRPTLPNNAPKQVPGSWPIFGSWGFFTERYGWFQRAVSQSKTGNFSFWVGQMPVIGLSGAEERRIFFESKGLAFGEAYASLLQGAPEVKNERGKDHASDSSGFSAYFSKRLTAMLKGPQLRKNLPALLQDARDSLDKLVVEGITDPFESIYFLVYRFTMRTVACNELANDVEQLEQSLHLFETIENSCSPLAIMFPWLPLPAKVTRTMAGAKLYMMFKKVVDERKKNDVREDDALQYLIDQGDNITDMLTFVLGSLFAGQLNSGINAAYILCYLATNSEWWARALEEVNTVADKHCPDKSKSLKDRLMEVPIEAWENEFPMIDLCLKDSIRLQMPGTAFRKNASGVDIPLSNGEVIPAGAYVALSATEIHQNPNAYTNPMDWNPSRYLRGEDKKESHTWIGWGLGRHPCLGMRFAKLENNLIVAFFLAYFESAQLLDVKGNCLKRVPDPNFQNYTAMKPDSPMRLKLHPRKE